MNAKKTDKYIILLFYLSIVIEFYFNGLSQTSIQERTVVPIYVLLFPFGVAVLQILRIMAFKGRVKLDSLSRIWVSIFIYYVFAFYIGYFSGHNKIDYNTIWFVVCPPLTWVYFTIVLKATPSLKDVLINWSFWFLVALASISLYFIPRSIRISDFFASLNTGYYVLFAYPMVLLNNSNLKKIIGSVLMVLVILFSMKRGGILSVVIAFSLYMLFATKASVIKKAIVMLICTVSLFYLIPKANEISNGTLQHRYEFSQNQGDEEGRAAMYPVVWSRVWDSSTLEVVFGHGHKAVVSDNVLGGLSAHNDYLEFLYDYGVLGLMLLLFYQLKLIKLTFQTQKEKKDFIAAIFAITSIIMLSMVSVVYAFVYFVIIIPFWCVLNSNYKIK